MAGDAVRAIQSRTVPIASLGRRNIGAGQKIEQHGVGVRGRAHDGVGQNELAEVRVEIGSRCYLNIAEANGFGVGIGIKGSLRECFVARPKSCAADLIRISFRATASGNPGIPPG